MPEVKYVGQIGRIDPFDENLEDIDTYIQRLNQFFSVNEIPDEKAPALLSLVGPKVFKLLKNILQPETPESKSYDKLCTALKGHHSPKPNLTAERFRFQGRRHQSGENSQDFLPALKSLSINCEFGANLSTRLLDGFVHGLTNSHIQKKLLSKSDLDLNKAIKIATSIEQANSDAQEIAKDFKSINLLIEKNDTKQRVAHRQLTSLVIDAMEKITLLTNAISRNTNVGFAAK